MLKSGVVVIDTKVESRVHAYVLLEVAHATISILSAVVVLDSHVVLLGNRQLLGRLFLDERGPIDLGLGFVVHVLDHEFDVGHGLVAHAITLDFRVTVRELNGPILSRHKVESSLGVHEG